MGPATEQLLQAALALPDQERFELVEALLASHAPPEELPFDPVWLKEVQQRSAEVNTGVGQTQLMGCCPRPCTQIIGSFKCPFIPAGI